MLKFIGSVFLGTVCVIYGLSRAGAMRHRRDFLTAFVTSLSVLETEISFGRRELADIFRHLDSGRLFGLYTACADNISKVGIRKAWDIAVADVSDQASLKTGDKDAILSLGAALGKCDIEGHMKAIHRAAALADQLAAEADDEYKRLGRAYRGCGFLAGAFCVLILI